MIKPFSCLSLVVAVFSLLSSALAPPARAQDVPVLEVTEDLAFDRPEAWAMKYFASVTQLTALEAPRTREPGEVEVGVEALWIPGLSREKRTVGFDGTKTEDLNRLPATVRPRVTVGLPGRLSLVGAVLPPIEVQGVEAGLLALALERPLVERPSWGLGARLYGQTGRIRGDFTCTKEDVASPPGSPGNEFGCEATSDDTYDLDTYGFELVGSHRFGGPRAPELHLGVAANYLDLQFQVDARRFGLRDRTLERTDGWTHSLTAGAGWWLGAHSHLAAELYYAPLTVTRPPATERQNDALLNARVMVGFRVR